MDWTKWHVRFSFIYTLHLLKEISPRCSLEGLMLKLKLPTLWLPDAESWLIWKNPDARKDWRREEKGMTEVGWHHQHNGHGFGWIPGVGDGQGVLGCCDSWGRKESDTTEWLNWTEHSSKLMLCINFGYFIFFVKKDLCIYFCVLFPVLFFFFNRQEPSYIHFATFLCQ